MNGGETDTQRTETPTALTQGSGGGAGALLTQGIREDHQVEIAKRAELAVGTLYKFFKGISNVFLEELIERPDDFSADKMAALAKQMFFDQVRLKRPRRAPSHP